MEFLNMRDDITSASSFEKELSLIIAKNKEDLEHLIVESNLSAWDYCFALSIGVAGISITTNKDFEHYLKEIHECASEKNGEYDTLQVFLGKKFHHKGDNIDMIERPFKTRNGTNSDPLFHRLLWGHDIFSNKNDNPFALMFKSSGYKGIIQALRHLLGDTCSKQGLPIPGSSYLDYVNDNNKTSNYLIDISSKLSEETFGFKNKREELYSHLFTVRAQDFTAGIVVKTLCEIYFLLSGIKDKLRKKQILFIAYAINFFGEACVGCYRQKGVPYINYPLGILMISSFSSMIIQEYKIDKKLDDEYEKSLLKTNKCIEEMKSILEEDYEE